MEAFLADFTLSFSLILAIGSQNAFVLRQGLRREHVFWICLTCAVSDAVLIAFGVSGFSLIIGKLPWVESVMRYAGSAFLIGYGAKSIWTACKSVGSLVPSEVVTKSLIATLGTCLALTWLNPHVYLDTVFLIGSISTGFPNQKVVFGLGATLASLVFFFSLGYGASLLRPLFAKPSAWRVLEIGIGITMWAIAAKLLLA